MPAPVPYSIELGRCYTGFIHITATQKKLELAEKYSKLKKSGKLEKFLTKKRRKNASRDRKALPARH